MGIRLRMPDRLCGRHIPAVHEQGEHLDIIEIIRSADSGGRLDALARSYGLEPVQLQALLVTVFLALAQRLEANTLSRGGVADLVAELSRPEHARLIDDPRIGTEREASDAGVRVLDTVFGDKAQSRALAARASAQTGVSQDLIQKLLPILASLIMGALAKGSQGGLQDILKRLPELGQGGGGMAPPPSRRGSNGQSDGARSRPARDPSPSGGDIDYGQDGPLPLPGSRIPGVNAPDDISYDGRPPQTRSGSGGYGSGPLGDLPDVIRRGGVKVDGDPLSGMVRSVLGSLLGFQSKGLMGWIVRLIVVRWVWGLLRGILGRAFGGR